MVDDDNDRDDADELDADDESEDSHTMNEGSFVKIKSEKLDQGNTIPENEDLIGPDVYGVDVLAWDFPVSALHLAILGGHVDVFEILCFVYGADVLLPVKILSSYNRAPRAAIMTMLLAQLTGFHQPETVTKSLLQLGASSAQADMHEISALHCTVHLNNLEILKILSKYDEPAAGSVLNHTSLQGHHYRSQLASPLLTAIHTQNVAAVNVLLSLGAQTSVEYEEYSKNLGHNSDGWSMMQPSNPSEHYQRMHKTVVQQPVILAVERDLPAVVQELVRQHVGRNTLTKQGQSVLLEPHNRMYQAGTTLLDAIRERLVALRDQATMDILGTPPEPLQSRDFYIAGFEKRTYQYWSAETDIAVAEEIICKMQAEYEQKLRDQQESPGVKERLAASQELIKEFEIAERMVIERGGKTFGELHHDITPPEKNVILPSYPGPLYSAAKPFEVSLDFIIPSQTERDREGYLQLRVKLVEIC